MQVPASTTETLNAQSQTVGASSTASATGIFGSSVQAATKKSLLPAFAMILAEQSGKGGSSEGASQLSDSTKGGGVGKSQIEGLPGAANTKAMILAHLQPLEVKGANPAQHPGAVSTKSETKTVRHRREGEASSVASEKKQSVSTSGLPPLSVASVVTPVAVMRAPLKNNSELSLSSTPNTAFLRHAVMTAAHDKEQPPAATVEGPASDEALSAVADSEKSDLREVEPASMLTKDGIVDQTAALTEQVSATRRDVAQSQPASVQAYSTADPVPHSDVNIRELPSAGAAAHEASSQVPPSKMKTPEKISSEPMRALAAPSHGAALTDSLHVNSDAVAATPSVGRPSLFGNADARKETATLDASTFQRLDSASLPTTLLHGSANQITVGVHDPSLGWLEVQTQSSSGHVSTTLAAASTEAHASLAAQVPAMTQYLADRNIPVHSLNIDTQNGGAGGGQPQSGSGHAQQESFGGNGVVIEENRRPLSRSTEDLSATEARSASYISVRA